MARSPQHHGTSDRKREAIRIARLRLSPELVGNRAVLEVSYQLTPDRGTPLVNTLQPPRLLDGLDSVPTRWQIVAPPGRVVLAPEPGAGSPQTGTLAGSRTKPTLRPPCSAFADVKVVALTPASHPSPLLSAP